ncbi:MAG: hypothetical protein PHS49_06850 [Candidatus Gracilibacteria bacterium]|nr:hypothetical protein [Candidatus Gracilibacteria bacterium]
MNNKNKLKLFLLISPGILAEIISSNTPISKLSNPFELIFLMIAYGIPILLIWNYKNKYNINYLGIFILGLAYGILNEGLLAKTLLENSPVVSEGFKNFGVFGGLNFSWFLLIIPWHAFFSVLFPIIFAEYVFPTEKNTIIGSKKTNIFLFIFCYIILAFVGKDWQGNLNVNHYIFFYSIIFSILIITKKYFKNTEMISTGKNSYRLGFLCTFHYISMFALAGKIPIILFFLIFCFTTIKILNYFIKLQLYDKSRFGVGSYLGFGVFTSIATLPLGRIDVTIMTIIIITLLHKYILNKKTEK